MSAAIHSNLFIHELDKNALNALKAIPGFTPLLKAWMKIWSEKQYKIENMATNLRLSQRQLPEYYAMLPPICERLGIPVPELYLTMDGDPNAYTAGDTEPFIVLTSGLIEKFPKELIPAVLAHECGHIACHHVLYHTMGRELLSAATSYLGMGDLFNLTLRSAFAHWMRCSELSADRAAAVCVSSSAPVIEYCMRFAGFPSKLTQEQGNREAFMEQALDYRAMLQSSAWNKVLELLMYSGADHPLNAVRAYECFQWAQTQTFTHLARYSYAQSTNSMALTDAWCPLPESSLAYQHRDSLELEQYLRSLGFTQIERVREATPDARFRYGECTLLVINGQNNLPEGSWFPQDARIKIHYYEPYSDAEILAQHPGEVRTPAASRQCHGIHYQQIIASFREAGFRNFIVHEQRDTTRGWFTHDKEVIRITIAGHDSFERGAFFPADAAVEILYRTLPPA